MITGIDFLRWFCLEPFGNLADKFIFAGAVRGDKALADDALLIDVMAMAFV